MIHFNQPPFAPKAFEYMQRAVEAHKICGDGEYTRLCSRWLEADTGAVRALLTTSCTHALEMAALLCDIHPGDEVILPSFTFCSTADAFVMRGATCVFVDIRPDTMNLDETLVEQAITPRTRAIAPVHYAGVGCEMDAILDIARRHNLYVVEDAAQAVGSRYKGKPLGTMGDFGTVSFHETKNFSMGEGGALLLRDESWIEPAEILREKGTNRSKFFRGQIDKYTWVDKGSSYLPSDLNAAYLWAQLEEADTLAAARMDSWNYYYAQLSDLAAREKITLPTIPAHCTHNAHMFYIKTRDLDERTALIAFLKQREIQAVFHYVPLHSSPAGRKFGRFAGEDRFTTAESDRLVRLPLYNGLAREDAAAVVQGVYDFYAET